MILIRDGCGLFSYLNNKKPKTEVHILFCDRCRHLLTYSYCYIIGKLKEANLLHPDSKTLCCGCHNYIKNNNGFYFRWY